MKATISANGKTIKTFEDELTWYFTEYQQRLDEAQNG